MDSWSCVCRYLVTRVLVPGRSAEASLSSLDDPLEELNDTLHTLYYLPCRDNVLGTYIQHISPAVGLQMRCLGAPDAWAAQTVQ